MTSILKSLFKVPVPSRPPIPAGKTRICVSGFGVSHNTGRAQKLAAEIAKQEADKYETWFYFSTFCYRDFVRDFVSKELPEDQKKIPSTLDSEKPMEKHQSAPFVWLEQGQNEITAIGGRDRFCQWAAVNFPDNESIQALTSLEEPPFSELFFDNATPGGTYLNSK